MGIALRGAGIRAWREGARRSSDPSVGFIPGDGTQYESPWRWLRLLLALPRQARCTVRDESSDIEGSLPPARSRNILRHSRFPRRFSMTDRYATTNRSSI